MIIPNRLYIEDGVLKLDDGSDVVEYLKRWQQKAEVANGDKVNVVDNDDLEAMNRVRQYAMVG